MALTAVFSTSALAQASATASTRSSATVVTPIAIANSVDLAFGTFAVTAAAGGTIKITPGSTSTVTRTGSVTSTKVSTPTAALFTVSGEKGFTYDLTLSATTFSLTGAAATGATTLTVSALETSLGGAQGTINATSGTEIVYVGGLLTIPAAAAKDVYTNTSAFSVTVNYN